jgi:alpha-glucosidase
MALKSMIAASVLSLILPLTASAAKNSHVLTSPDGKITVEIETGGKVSYSVFFNGKEILAPSEIAMSLDDGTVFGNDAKVKKANSGTFRKVHPAVAYKKASVEDHYNYLILQFKNHSVEFRAFDNGVAYRFVSTAKRGTFNVKDEKAEFNFPEDWMAWIPYTNTGFETLEEQFGSSFENYYQHINLSQWDARRLAFLPLVVDAPDGVKICIMESDLYSYPGMYLRGAKNLKGVFAPYPDRIEQGGHNDLQGLVKTRKDFIAKAEAGRSFPWRILGIVPEAKELTNLDLVWQLSTPPAADSDWSWVKPGKVAWDWWNDWNIYGVDFRAGINNDTYKYYIDFASENGIEYVILDEGWAVNRQADLYQIVPEIDLRELIAYADSKQVGLILWAGYWALNRDIEGICKHYAQMGIKGFKVDFMNRDDQPMVEFYEQVSAAAAKYHLLVDFHGAYKPTGLERTYPNVLNFEGVAGLEQMKWSRDADQVTYDCTIPFIRMAAGRMDYTQGAMRNAIRQNYRPVNSEAMSQGTRCRQLAEYAIFDAPLTMLCDSPSAYRAEPECTEFITSFPTTWDETVPICGEIGEYVAIARRKGDSWYVGAITNWTPRDLTLDLSFLGSGSWSMTAFEDGINADRIARDYVKRTLAVPEGKQVNIRMAPGGGWAAILTK